MEEWKTYTASDFCIKVTDGTHDSPKPKDSGHYLITSKHLKDNCIDFSLAYRISEEDYQKIIKRSNVVQHDILFSMIGTIGNIVRITAPIVDFAVKNMAIFKMGGNELKSKWLYYWLQSPSAKEYIASRLAGSTQAYLTLDSIRQYPISSPSEVEMKKIVDILQSIDDKIELNNRINHNLEEQAQALYKSWFVDFEPFRGGNFVDSELGLIPEGWRVGCYNDIISSTVSGDWGKDREEGNYTHKVSCIRGCDFADVSSGIRGKTPERFILEKNFKNKRLIDKDIVVEISGGTPTVSTGRICLVSDNLLDRYSGNIVCTNFCRVIRPCSGYSSYVFYSWLDKYKSRVMFGYENGTSGIKNFQISDFMEKEPVIIPPQTVIAKFQTIVEFYQAVIQRNGNERMECETVRDTLLPKLMSGELKINDLTC